MQLEFMKFQHISSALFCICIALTMAMSCSQLCNRRLSTFCLVCFSVLHALCFSLIPLSFTVFLLYVFVYNSIWLENKDLTENNGRENSKKYILKITKMLILCNIMKVKVRY